MAIELNSSINKGVAFLAKEQNPDGSFTCLVSKKLDDYRAADEVPAIVPVNMVLSSLIHVNGVSAEKIKEKAADFLYKEKGEYWSFNYWFRRSDWYGKEPYPDDLDDTFCALAALYEYWPKRFDGKVMAKIATMLTSAEKQEGGPYDMWLVPPEGRDRWDDTDLVVNSNVAFFLALQDISLPNVDAFIEKSIDEQDYEFPYNTIYPAIYFISRFYKGEKGEKVVKLLLKNQESDGKWENPLRTALVVSSLINFSGNNHFGALKKGIAYLQKTQAKNGSWPPYSFYWQCRLPERTLYAGSSSITSALCVEALDKFGKLENGPKVPGRQQSAPMQKNTMEDVFCQKILAACKKRFALLGADTRRLAEKNLSQTAGGNKGREILLLPYFFKKSLGGVASGVDDIFIIKLGMANALGWMAYTIYDDFFDGEGSIKMLSIANICLRESAAIFGAINPPDTGFGEFSKSIFDMIDDANMWEANYCHDTAKPPDYGDYSGLAERSLGHALGPAAILFALGYGEGSPELKKTLEFFRHYIIARQLNDDAHDWEDDLKRGQVNAVAAKLLSGAKRNQDDLEELRLVFWQKTIVGVCADINSQVKKARQCLASIPIIKDTGFFEPMLLAEENSATKALQERKETLIFINAYKPG